MAELDQDIDFSAAIVGATPKKAPAVVKKNPYKNQLRD